MEGRLGGVMVRVVGEVRVRVVGRGDRESDSEG